MEELDEMDRKILAALDFNARVGYTALGKKLGKTKQYARHRVERLKKRGIIKGIDTVVDVSRLGYLYIRLLVQYSKITPENEQQMIDFFKERKEAAWIATEGGIYDFVAVLMTKTVRDYEKILDEFSTTFHENIAEAHTSIATRIWHFPHKVFHEKPPYDQLIFGENPADEDIDIMDQKILRALLKDGSINSVKLGQEVNLSPAAVLSRLRRLEKEKIILAYRLNIDTAKLGYQTYKVFLTLHKVDNEFLKEFEIMGHDHKNILYITKALGFAALELYLIAKDNKEFYEILKEFRLKFAEHIKDVSFLEEYGTYHVSYTPF
jgi:DNA-binding Lrp family transcriptional regulator